MPIFHEATDPASGQPLTPSAGAVGVTAGWFGTAPLLADLLGVLVPEEIVVLGLQEKGGVAEAYVGLCAAAPSAASLFGIDRWRDPVGGMARVPEALQRRNAAWQDRSGLICADPLATAEVFEAESVDLLLLAPPEGAAQAGAWLSAWRPTLSTRGVVLLLAGDAPEALPGYDDFARIALGGLLLLIRKPDVAGLAEIVAAHPKRVEAPQVEAPQVEGGAPIEEAPLAALNDSLAEAAETRLLLQRLEAAEAAVEAATAGAAVSTELLLRGEAEREALRARVAELEDERQRLARQLRERAPEGEAVELLALNAITSAAEAEAERLRRALEAAERQALSQQAERAVLEERLRLLEARHQAELQTLTGAAATGQEMQLEQRLALQEALRNLEDSRRIQLAQDRRVAGLLAELIQMSTEGEEIARRHQDSIAQEREARATVEAAHAALEVRVAALYRSMSWRVTGPLRRIRRVITRG